MTPHLFVRNGASTEKASNATVFAAIRALPAVTDEQRFRCHRTYLDSQDGRLLARGLVLEYDSMNGSGRVRLRRLGSEQTLWTSAMAQAPGSADDISSPTVSARLRGSLDAAPLVPLLECRVSGTRWRLIDRLGKTTACLQWERCKAVRPAAAGKGHDWLRIQPLRGFEAASLPILDAGMPPALESVSWDPLERLVEDVATPPPPHRKKQGLRIPSAATVHQGTAAVLHAYLNDMADSERRIFAGDDPEALHDLRVAMRRSRSLLQAMGADLDERRCTRFVEALRWLNRASGPTRDLDVFLGELEQGKLEGSAILSPETVTQLTAIVTERQRECRQALLHLLRGSRYLEFKDEWAVFVQSLHRVDSDKPVAEAAAGAIEHQHRRFLNRAERALATEAFTDLHTWRKAGKRLRYVVEGFGSLFPARSANRAIRELKKLQDQLGTICDRVVQRELLREFEDALRVSRPAGAREIAALGDGIAITTPAELTELRRQLSSFTNHATRSAFQRLTEID